MKWGVTVTVPKVAMRLKRANLYEVLLKIIPGIVLYVTVHLELLRQNVVGVLRLVKKTHMDS